MASAKLAARPRGCDGDAVPDACDVEGRAMIRRRAHERQPQRGIHAGVERQRLERDEGLIVVHGDGRVVARARRGMKQAVGGQRAGTAMPLGREARPRPGR